LSKALITDLSKVELRTAADLKIKYGTNLRLGVVCPAHFLPLSTSTDPLVLQTVTSIQPTKKAVILDSGKETISYDSLILASGGTPRRLPIEGADLDNVYTFRGLEDSKKVDSGKPAHEDNDLTADAFV
jgi:hypothetical protein